MKDENNKLLAEFLEIKVLKDVNEYTGKEYYYYNNFELKDFEALPDYNSDWNELMKVVEKIESKNYEVIIGGKNQAIIQDIYFAGENGIITERLEATKIKTVFEACVDFVNWYNINN